MADYLVACSTLALSVKGKMRALHLGDRVSGEGEPFESLERAGYLTTGVEPVDAAPGDNEPVEDPDEEPQDDKADDPAPAAATGKGKVERPKQTASIDDWRKYAESLGVKTTGLKKPELIAATR